jgi:PDZ domain-containing protein
MTDSDPFSIPAEPTPPPPPSAKWPYLLVAAFLAVGLLVLVFWDVSLPYFAMAPGPTEEVADLVSFGENVTVYQTTGDLFLLTVTLREVNPFEWFEARYLDDKVDLLERDVIRPPGSTDEQVRRSNLEAMNESIDTAIFVALNRLGYEVGFVGDGVEVLQVVEGTPAEGVLQVDDRFSVIAGEEVTTSEDAGEVIRSHAIGDTITLSGTRDGEPIELSVTLVEHTQLPGSPMIGVVFDTINLEMDLPIDVDVDSRNIGGPSAGMMYTIALLDLLTEEDLTGGHRIAGTGTIRFDETVGAIGGVRQKVFAARAIGAEIVFVPADNLDVALTAADGDIVVVPIATLQEALDYLRALAPIPELVASSK